MSCANFQELLAGQGAATATDFTPANIDFPYDSDDDLRLDIYNYQDQAWVNVPLATGATIDVGGAGDVFYAWETYLTDGQTGVRTILATAGTTPALPAGGTASHPLAPANNNYPVEGGTGVNVRLYRQTSIEAGELPAYFYPGASIRAQDLNDNFEALRKVVEESNCATNNINDGAAQLDARYWNKLDDTLENGDAWVSDDAHIATTAAGDTRWLNATGGNVIGGDGIEVTEAGGNVTISVDLDDVSGLEFDGGELRIDANNGCEIVADGLNAQTTGASIAQTGGTDANPAIRITETLGTTVTNTDLTITGGANTTVTRNSNNQLTISSSGGTGLTYRGTVNPTTTGTTSALVDGDINDVYAVDTTGTIDDDPDWETAINGTATTVTAGDLLQCVTAGDGTAANTRFTLIETGTGTPNLQAVTTEGNTTTAGIITRRATATDAGVRVEDASNNPAILLFGNGVATFNEQGLASDFRVESDGQTHMLFVDGTNNRVGIGTDAPTQALGVNGSIQTGSWDGTTGSGATVGETGTLAIRPATTGNANVVSIIPTDTGNINTVFRADGSAHFNAANNNADFRVDGDTNDNMLFVDASTDRVGIGINAPLGTLHIVGPNEAASGQLRIVSDADDQNARATFYRNGTFVGSLQGDATNLFFQLEGTNDWRVDTNTTQNMLFVDGGEDRVGIGTDAPDSTLDVDGQVTITQNAIAAGAGNWNLANGNFWTLGAVVIPNPTNMVAGMSGLIVNTAQATWPNAGGATFQYADNTPPNITQFPAVIPFYCTNNTTIFIGTPTVNIV